MSVKWLKKIFHAVFSTADRRVSFYLKFILFCKKNKLNVLTEIVSRRLQRKYGVFIASTATFDESLILRHPIGIVIGKGVEIGRDVTIFQNVTLGKADTNINAYPRIGHGTIVYAGAVVLGDVHVGNNCIVGANSVVIRDVPDNSIAVGSPARIIPNNVK